MVHREQNRDRAEMADQTTGSGWRFSIEKVSAMIVKVGYRGVSL